MLLLFFKGLLGWIEEPSRALSDELQWMAGVCGEREAIGAEARGGIDSESGQDGGVEVFRADGSFANPHGRFVGRAVDESARYASSGQHGGVAVWPVISSDG